MNRAYIQETQRAIENLEILLLKTQADTHLSWDPMQKQQFGKHLDYED